MTKEACTQWHIQMHRLIIETYLRSLSPLEYEENLDSMNSRPMNHMQKFLTSAASTKKLNTLFKTI